MLEIIMALSLTMRTPMNNTKHFESLCVTFIDKHLMNIRKVWQFGMPSKTHDLSVLYIKGDFVILVSFEGRHWSCFSIRFRTVCKFASNLICFEANLIWNSLLLLLLLLLRIRLDEIGCFNIALTSLWHCFDIASDGIPCREGMLSGILICLNLIAAYLSGNQFSV